MALTAAKKDVKYGFREFLIVVFCVVQGVLGFSECAEID